MQAMHGTRMTKTLDHTAKVRKAIKESAGAGLSQLNRIVPIMTN